MDKNEFRHGVFNKLERSKLDPAEAYWNIVEGSYTEKEIASVWHINISVEKNLTIGDIVEV